MGAIGWHRLGSVGGAVSTPVEFFSFVQGERTVVRVSGAIGGVTARLVIVPDPDNGYLAMWPAYGVMVRTHYRKTEPGVVTHELEVCDGLTFRSRKVRHGVVHQDIEVLSGEETYRRHEQLVIALLSGFWLHQMNS